MRRGYAITAIAVLVVSLALIWFATGGRLRWGGGPGLIRSLAVLPLTNLSGDPAQDYFADAMTEELTTRLAKMGTWRITSRTSVMEYRGTRKKADAIARELGVDALIEGSVIRDGPRVKVTAQLIDGETDRHIWAETYERELEGVLTIQSEVARAIAREVGMSLTPDAEARLSAATRPVLPAAYDAYVRGRHAWEKRGESALRTAIKYFQESIDADPTYAPAYAGLADCYAQLGYSSYISPDDSFPRARAAAGKAIELDPSLADAHASLGYVRMYYDWNFADAESQFKRAIALNPNYAIAHQWYAYLLTAMERVAEAEREISIARQLDPLSAAINTDLAFIFHYNSRNQEALRSAQMALEMDPKFLLGYFWLGRIATAQGHYKEAEDAFQNIGPMRSWTPAMAALGYLYAKSGQPDRARGVIGEFDELKGRAGTRPRTPSPRSTRVSMTVNVRSSCWRPPIPSARIGSSGSNVIRAGMGFERIRDFRLWCARSGFLKSGVSWLRQIEALPMAVPTRRATVHETAVSAGSRLRPGQSRDRRLKT